MRKLFNYLFCIFMFAACPVFAYEDCVISTNVTLTDIKIEHNNIIDVYPLITLMNDKNVLIVQALTEGETRFSVLKNKSEKIIFNVKVSKEGTKIDEVAGFEIETLDLPPENYDDDFELDLPPMLREEAE